MKVLALVSGGKDSCYAMQLCIEYGHEIVALGNLYPMDESVDEMDSYMYQTVGHQFVAALAQCMGLPLFRRRIQGDSRVTDLRYVKTNGDEVEDLEILIRAVKVQFPDLGGVSTGAIASDYQRLRVENVCSRLGLVSLAYLWKQKQPVLLQTMIHSGLNAILVKVAAIGLDPQKHLGRDLLSLQPLLLKLQDLYGSNVCGEGGEYESLTLDSPLFKNGRIILDEFTIHLHSADSIAPVGILHPIKFHIEAKSDPCKTINLEERVWVEVSETQSLPGDKVSASVTASDASNLSPAVFDSGKDLLSVVVNRQRHGYMVISCTRQSSHSVVQELQDELDHLLSAVEDQLRQENKGWADVLYVQLFLDDMAKFAQSNEKYMDHIKEELCVKGVPSRCCVQLPLVECGIGQVMVEVLTATCSDKQVLHVQSISCWAPSCIGPYSQATLNGGLLYMAGQLGLHPPTMALVRGGGADEMSQAMRNCEAVGSVFTTSFPAAVLSYTVYLSSDITLVERKEINDILESYKAPDRRRSSDLQTQGQWTSTSPGFACEPLVLFILVPGLPKSALVEVAPLSCIIRPVEEFSDNEDEPCPGTWKEYVFETQDHPESGNAQYLTSTCRGLVLPRFLCRAFSHILLRAERESSSGVAAYQIIPRGEVSTESSRLSDLEHDQLEEGSMSSRQDTSLTSALRNALQSLTQCLEEASLHWGDVIIFRLYFAVKLVNVQHLREAVTGATSNVTNRCLKGGAFSTYDGPKPILIPVLAVGENSEMRGAIALEITASGEYTRKL